MSTVGDGLRNLFKNHENRDRNLDMAKCELTGYNYGPGGPTCSHKCQLENGETFELKNFGNVCHDIAVRWRETMDLIRKKGCDPEHTIRPK